MTEPTQLIISALETGVDLARGNAEAVHANYKGYYPERHAAADRDVSDMEAALTAARAHLEQPSEPDCVGGSPCTTCADKQACATGCVRMGEFVGSAAPSTAGERAAFEAWLRSKWTPGYAFPKTNDGEYEHGEAQRFWGCWQAAALQSTALPDHPEQHLDMAAEIRDLFPVPAPCSALEPAWAEAMANPASVPAYVRACLDARPVGERDRTIVSLPIPASASDLKSDIAELIQSHKYKGLRSIEVLGVFQFLGAEIISGSNS